MRTLTLLSATLLGLGGCVYDPYYGYYAPDPFVEGAVVGAAVGVAGTVVLTDPDYWPYHYGGYYRYPYYRYPYRGWHGRPYPYGPYPHGGRWHH